MTEVPAVIIAIQHCFGGSSKCNNTRTLNNCYKHWKKRNKTSVSPPSGRILIYPENPKEFRRKTYWK